LTGPVGSAILINSKPGVVAHPDPGLVVDRGGLPHVLPAGGGESFRSWLSGDLRAIPEE